MRNGLRFGFAVLALALGCDDTTDHPEGLDAQVPVDMTCRTPTAGRGERAAGGPRRD
ncbi:MAG: hypothetical protein U0325_34785 [Polyangiales bacterium]